MKLIKIEMNIEINTIIDIDEDKNGSIDNIYSNNNLKHSAVLRNIRMLMQPWLSPYSMIEPSSPVGLLCNI